jgi:hypothetical protein
MDGGFFKEFATLAAKSVYLSDGTMDVTYKGVKVLDNVETCYVPAAGRFALAARNGGASDTHEIDDLRITSWEPGAGGETLADSGPCSLRHHRPRAGGRTVTLRRLCGGIFLTVPVWLLTRT